MKRQKVILIAGWGLSEADVEPLARILRGTLDVRSTSVADLRSESGPPGRAGAGGGGRLSPYAIGLDRLLAVEGSPCALVGWSMGGMAALELAAAKRPAVAALILIGSTPRFCQAPDYPHGVPIGNLRAMKMGIRRDLAETLHGFFGDFYFPTEHAHSLHGTRIEMAEGQGVETLLAGLDYLQKTDLRDMLGGLDLPTLILHGKKDRIVPWSAAEFLQASIPRARLLLHDGVGHALPETDCARVAARIAGFLGAGA